MDSDEFLEWQVFNQLSPIGLERLDWLVAMLAMVTANTWADKPHKIGEFVPKWNPEEASNNDAMQMKAWMIRQKCQQERRLKGNNNT